MRRELASNDRLVATRWPVVYWLNRASLIAAGLCLLTVMGLLLFEALQPLAPALRSTVDGLIGAAYVLTALMGVAFMVTGYLRLWLVHSAPGHAPHSRPARRAGSPFQRLAGAVVFLGAASLGWIHWGWSTAILFVVVFAVVYLPIRLR